VFYFYDILAILLSFAPVFSDAGVDVRPERLEVYENF
tara:strand:- start:287 stop:397 length:111 start_codon:yes stop_codon:yes gene_type:complete